MAAKRPVFAADRAGAELPSARRYGEDAVMTVERFEAFVQSAAPGFEQTVFSVS